MPPRPSELRQVLDAIEHLDGKLDAHIREFSDSRHEHGKLLVKHGEALTSISERRRVTAGALVSGTIALLTIIATVIGAWISMERRITSIETRSLTSTIPVPDPRPMQRPRR